MKTETGLDLMLTIASAFAESLGVDVEFVEI